MPRFVHCRIDKRFFWNQRKKLIQLFPIYMFYETLSKHTLNNSRSDTSAFCVTSSSLSSPSGADDVFAGSRLQKKICSVTLFVDNKQKSYVTSTYYNGDTCARRVFANSLPFAQIKNRPRTSFSLPLISNTVAANRILSALLTWPKNQCS